MREEVDIPESASQVKPWFPTRADAETRRREIKTYIKDGGEPHLWPGHTHTTPPLNSFPVYLDEFDLPEKDRKSGKHAVCPCCEPRHRKYAKKGKIAWFPDEGVVRLLGPNCFESLSPEGHQQATKQMEIEVRRRRSIAYLLANIDLPGQLLAAISAAMPLARGLDGFGAALRQQEAIRKLWTTTRGGSVQVIRRETENVTDRAGNTISREVDRLQDYAPVAGRTFIDPGRQSLADRLVRAEEAIRPVAAVTEAPDSMTDETRRKLEAAIKRAHVLAADVFDDMREAWLFFSAANLATLRTWGRMPEAVFPLYISRDRGILLIGADAEHVARIPMPTKAIDSPPAPLPQISTVVDIDL